MQKNHLSSVTAVLPFKVEEVWQALINPDLVKKYFFGTILETSWLPGTPIIFRGEWEGQSY
ncbi:MAG: SRPBCC domain-containing protein, partial [Bacteroidetes bacterium]|nr:SRPBCC domain-containing protein [Bacteroidota bacterium]